MSNVDVIFVVLLGIVFYSYIGYGIILFLFVKIKQVVFGINKITIPKDLPSITLLIAAYNEQDIIEEKISNSLKLNYPSHKLQFIIVTDGSSDRTPLIVQQYTNITLLHQNTRKGKTAAVNRAMKEVITDVVVFTDANTMLNDNALLEIAKHYDEDKVGCVSGEKRVRVPDKANASAAGEGLYWKYESKLKQWDSELYSAAGAAGELFSIRTTLYEDVEEDTILDDFMISLKIVQKGFKIAYEPNAYALENSSEGIKEELKRKIRICAGGFQSILRLGSLLNIFKFHIFTFQYLSHRVLRWTVAPLALLILIPLNLFASLYIGNVYKVLLLLQIIFYTMAFIGWKYESRSVRKKMFFIPFYFVMMNYSVFAGFKRFAFGEQSQMWDKAKRAV
jgi:poly-beta-1,6-N-acetyl-D-glucosamine synthase